MCRKNLFDELMSEIDKFETCFEKAEKEALKNEETEKNKSFFESLYKEYVNGKEVANAHKKYVNGKKVLDENNFSDNTSITDKKHKNCFCKPKTSDNKLANWVNDSGDKCCGGHEGFEKGLIHKNKQLECEVIKLKSENKALAKSNEKLTKRLNVIEETIKSLVDGLVKEITIKNFE